MYDVISVHPSFCPCSRALQGHMSLHTHATFPATEESAAEHTRLYVLQMCGSSSWLIPAGLSLPYIWRLCQCIRTWRDRGDIGQAFNALKYSTAFPVIILSAVNFQVTDEDWNRFWKPLWLASAFLNSAYSYYWDIERDWEISFFSSQSGALLDAMYLTCSTVCNTPTLYADLHLSIITAA